MSDSGNVVRVPIRCKCPDCKREFMFGYLQLLLDLNQDGFDADERGVDPEEGEYAEPDME